MFIGPHSIEKDTMLLTNFHIGTYHDSMLCDIISIDSCHMLLGLHCQYDRKIVHDGMKNTFLFKKYGKKIITLPMNEGKGAINSRNIDYSS